MLPISTEKQDQLAVISNFDNYWTKIRGRAAIGPCKIASEMSVAFLLP